MSDVWVGIVNRFVEKLFNVKGGPTVVDIQPSVQVILPLESGNENRYLQGWNRYGFNVTVAAVAAQAGAVQIRNPLGSSVVAVVESIIAFGAGQADQPNLTWGATVTDLPTVASLTFTRLDPRGNPQPTCIISSGTDGLNAAVFQQAAFAANTSVQFISTPKQEYTLLPGQILKMFSAVLNQVIGFSILWRERVAETSELA